MVSKKSKLPKMYILQQLKHSCILDFKKKNIKKLDLQEKTFKSYLP